MKLSDFKVDANRKIVDGIQTVLEELSVIKKSLNGNVEGPLGIKEAASYLKVSTQTLYKEVEQGTIPHYQNSPGSRIFFYQDELNEWIKSKKASTKAEVLKQANNLKIGNYGK